MSKLVSKVEKQRFLKNYVCVYYLNNNNTNTRNNDRKAKQHTTRITTHVSKEASKEQQKESINQSLNQHKKIIGIHGYLENRVSEHLWRPIGSRVGLERYLVGFISREH